MACRSGIHGRCGRRPRSGGAFAPPFCQGFGGFGSRAGSGPSPFGCRIPSNQSPEVVAVVDLRELFANAAPILQEIADLFDAKLVEEAIQVSLGETESETQSKEGTNRQFNETVKVDKSAGDTEKHRVDINLGEDVNADSLKISRKDQVMTINVKTEKSAEDGSSRLYQEYTKKITLPENVDLSQLESVLSPQGVLTIQAPFLPKPEETKPVSNLPIPIPVFIEDDTTRTE